jgi:pimeloyl-ACP methyl ester carboxylesterase
MTESSVLTVRELGDGPPLVLLNGYAASKEDWDPGFLDGLASASTVICPDNRGIGGPAAGVGSLSVASMAADVVAVLDDRRIETADVAGWSMGGFVAQQLAASAPERVRRLALLSTDPGGPNAVRSPEDIWGLLVDHSGTPREQATRLLKLLFPSEFAARVDAEAGDAVAAAREQLLPEELSSQEAAMNRWHAESAEARLAAITAQAYVAAGTEDVVIPPANSRLLADALPGSKFELYDGGGHAFMAQEPQRLSAAINGWLGR